jgi:hypothetical protein
MGCPSGARTCVMPERSTHARQNFLSLATLRATLERDEPTRWPCGEEREDVGWQATRHEEEG